MKGRDGAGGRRRTVRSQGQNTAAPGRRASGRGCCPGSGLGGQVPAAVGGPNGDNAGRDTQLVCLRPKPGDILNSSLPEELAPAPLPAGRVVWEARLRLENPEVGPVTPATSAHENL